MAKLFTITEGLENLGALKTGGQGSVYKGKRTNGTITAIKLLPTPIFNESEDDKAYRDFKNEVEKLKKVNQQPNPHVVKILSWGVTDTGNFPFIEMEFIEGPDLEELLKPPHDPVFTIKEIIKVAEHLSNALAHCHAIDVKHGDIKSNNIKYNIHSGQYMLLDFGLAAMSDEQRRTSLRHAGAIEFMAPEQSEGNVLFQTDVYSYGIILYELIAGRVPFPLADKSESARNKVMLAHMDAAPPDIIKLRSQHLPASWNEEKQKSEMQVPLWLLKVVEKCLLKDAGQRFRDGRELFAIVTQNVKGNAEGSFAVVPPPPPQPVNDGWLQEKRLIQQQLHQQQKTIDDLRQQVVTKDHLLKEAREAPRPLTPPPVIERKGVSSAAFYSLLLITALLAAFAAYSLFINPSFLGKEKVGKSRFDTTSSQYQTEEPTQQPIQTIEEPLSQTTVEDTVARRQQEAPPVSNNPMQFDTAATVRKEPQPQETRQKDTDTASAATTNGGAKKYKVKGKAFFHNEPDEGTRRNAFIVHWNNAILTPIDEKDGFVYIIFTNAQGQTSRGWILKSDLEEVKE